MKRFFLVLTLLSDLFFSVIATAQNNNKFDAGTHPELSLRTSLHSYFDYDAGIMLGINYHWTEKFSASLEPTWIFYNGFSEGKEEKIYPSGIKIRTDIRYHFPKRRKKGLDIFMAPELHLKFVRTRRLDDFGIDCQNGQCAFIQEAVYTEIKNEIGGIFKIGAIAPLTFINKGRWFLEAYGGFGLKQQKFRETDLPAGGSFINPPNHSFIRWDITSNGRNIIAVPLFPVGLKLVFGLK